MNVKAFLNRIDQVKQVADSKFLVKHEINVKVHPDHSVLFIADIYVAGEDESDALIFGVGNTKDAALDDLLYNIQAA